MSGFLDEPVTALSYQWTLERSDGAGLALTSHDQPLMLGDTIFRPAPGLMPSAVQRSAGLEVVSGEAKGALSARALTKRDFIAGRWDGARSHLFAADWQRPSQDHVSLQRGELGGIHTEGDSFSADLLGAASRLDRPICPLTSPECRAEFGDNRCRVDLAGRTLRASVVEAAGERIVLNHTPEGRFLHGRIRWWSGENAGLWSTVIAIDGAALILREPPPSLVAIGESIVCHEGCDQTFATCRARFNNAINFQGEPHLPGNDLLTSYPGG